MALTDGVADNTWTGGTNDAPGGSSWWDSNSGSVITALSDTVGDLLTFGVQYAAIQNGQPAPSQGGGVVYVPAPANQPQAQQTSTWVYVIAIIAVLILVLGGVYLFTRKSKA